MNRFLIAPLLALGIMGCTTNPKTIGIIQHQKTVNIEQPPLPRPIKLDNIKWYVLNGNTIEDVKKEVSKINNGNFAMAAMTMQDYERLSYNTAEIDRYIKEMNRLINYYRKVTNNND